MGSKISKKENRKEAKPLFFSSIHIFCGQKKLETMGNVLFDMTIWANFPLISRPRAALGLAVATIIGGFHK